MEKYRMCFETVENRLITHIDRNIFAALEIHGVWKSMEKKDVFFSCKIWMKNKMIKNHKQSTN